MSKRKHGGKKWFYTLGQIESRAGVQLTGNKLRKMRKLLGSVGYHSYCDGFNDYQIEIMEK